MRNDRKIRSDAYLANLPEERQEQIAQWCEKPADRDEETNKAIPRTGGIYHAREQLAADGIKVSEKSLSEWYSDWRDARRLSNASRKAQNFEEWLKDRNPTLTAEQVRAGGQIMFMSEAIEQQDAKTFFLISRLQLAQQQLEHEREKFKAAIRTKLEAGLDALWEEIRGNAKAEALFAQLREVVA